MPHTPRIEIFGNATLYLGDCMDILPTLPAVDAVITDPPYGMSWNTDSKRFSGGVLTRRHKQASVRVVGRNDWGDIHQDDQPFDPVPWMAFPKVIFWGANHFAARLPTGTTLVWIKKDAHLFGTFLSDAEVGWQKGGHGVYCFHKSFPPPSRILENDGEHAAHPTQKPIALMAWCIERLGRPRRILDPYMGSGTTGIAALQAGQAFVGVEIVPRHFDKACRRIEQAANQGQLFAPPPETAEQLGLEIEP